MEAAEKPEMCVDYHAGVPSIESGHAVLSGENPAGSISFPRIRGGIVTRMSIIPVTGVITELNIETSEPSISFPEEVRFDLNAKINIQRIIIIGGSERDHQ